jgi:hypothetical protein
VFSEDTVETMRAVIVAGKAFPHIKRGLYRGAPDEGKREGSRD